MASRRGAMQRRWAWVSTRGPGMRWPVTVRQHARYRGFSWLTAFASRKLELSASRPAKGAGRKQRRARLAEGAISGHRLPAPWRQPRSVIGIDRVPPSRLEFASG
jgi:hypothetical protein